MPTHFPNGWKPLPEPLDVVLTESGFTDAEGDLVPIFGRLMAVERGQGLLHWIELETLPDGLTPDLASHHPALFLCVNCAVSKGS